MTEFGLNPVLVCPSVLWSRTEGTPSRDDALRVYLQALSSGSPHGIVYNSIEARALGC